MSKRYPGGLITKTPVTPTPSSAPGIWTLEQQLQAQQAGTWPFGGPFNYIEDVFSTYLYAGNGGTITISNGIDLAGNGGIAWIKRRNSTTDHFVFGSPSYAGALKTNLTNGNTGDTAYLRLSSGFSLDNGSAGFNASGGTYASWTFRKQPKFFDVVTYTGTGSNRTISHNLGSVPGCIIVKSLAVGGAGYDWRVYHRSLTSAAFTIQLNQTNAQSSQPSIWNSTAPTSAVFSVGTDISVNEAGNTYVAYLFAHNAGGFGLTGSDNVITCGSYTGTNAFQNINLGYEPQFLIVKNASNLAGWLIKDSMRWLGNPSDSYTPSLFPNTNAVEDPYNWPISATSTGFCTLSASALTNASGNTYIYIAIRRGPMKVPTVGTSVYNGITYTGTNAARTISSVGFAADLVIGQARLAPGGAPTTDSHYVIDKLRGNTQSSFTDLTIAEQTSGATQDLTGWTNTGYSLGTGYANNINSNNYGILNWNFQRAPGFFDVVCYTGTGTSALAVTHNLQAVPQLIITKQRDAVRRWQVYSVTTGASAYLVLNTTAASTGSSSMWNATTPTSTTFTVGDIGDNNVSGGTYVAYLFATCPGVSKVGSYSGTGATQTIDCGFTGGARFVLIKRTDSTGGWYVWDTARGMVAGTDPSLFLNSTAAEVNANSVYTTGVGFQIVSTAAGINASGGTYIFLAVA
jgi:hypothetical protein